MKHQPRRQTQACQPCVLVSGIYALLNVWCYRVSAGKPVCEVLLFFLARGTRVF